MVDRIEEMDTVCDIVFILANTNDYASQIPIGNDNDNVNTTYKGAMNIIFTWLKNTYRTQPIIISTMLTRKENFNESTAVGNDKYLWFVFKNTEPSTSEIASATQASAEISLDTSKYSYASLNSAMSSTNPTELEALVNLPVDGSISYKYDVNGNTVVWTFNKRNVVLIEEYVQAIRDMVAKYRFILYDAYNLSGLDLLNCPKDGSSISNDGLHPNDAGSLSLGRKIAAFINMQ